MNMTQSIYITLEDITQTTNSVLSVVYLLFEVIFPNTFRYSIDNIMPGLHIDRKSYMENQSTTRGQSVNLF